jgi:hypothetical protein
MPRRSKIFSSIAVKNPALVALKEENAKRTGSAAKEIEPTVRKRKRKRLRKAVGILRIALSVSLSGLVSAMQPNTYLAPNSL